MKIGFAYFQEKQSFKKVWTFMGRSILEQYIYNVYGLDCVNEAIIHTEIEKHSTLEAHFADSLFGTSNMINMQTGGGESRPVHSCLAGQRELSCPGPSACIPPWTRTHCWAVGRCQPCCT